MNSDHAPTAEEQLPPYLYHHDLTEDERRDVAIHVGTRSRELLADHLAGRDRQLLAALRENREKDARIAELEKRCNVFMQGLEAEEKDCEALHTTLEAAEAKLRAVSDALDEKLEKYSSSRRVYFYRGPDVDAIFVKLRAIVEGK